MNLTLKTGPATEPLTLADAKTFLRISDYNDMSAGLTIEESILIALRTPGTVEGLSVDVTGYLPTVEVNAGTVVATGKLNIKIQHSTDNLVWVDWYSFAEITPSNDEAVYKYQYTGDYQYIRVVGVLTLANATYSANIILDQGYASEDDYILSLITAARQYCERYQDRAYITQTWELSMQAFPSIIELPLGNLQTVDSITYKDSAGVITTLAATEYVVSTKGHTGVIVPAYGKTFPVFTAYPLDAIVITFTCGYGDAADVPKTIIHAIKLLISHWYETRTPIVLGSISPQIEFSLKSLLWQERRILV